MCHGVQLDVLVGVSVADAAVAAGAEWTVLSARAAAADRAHAACIQALTHRSNG